MSLSLQSPIVVALALGGNLGNVSAAISDAVAEIASVPMTRLLAASRLYSTAPIGIQAGNRFLNAVVLFDTRLPPVSLLRHVQSIEDTLGRVRTQRWGSRTIDIDILSWGDGVVEVPGLSIPHPACWYRRFVLDPWTDVAPDWAHPRLGETVAAMRSRLLVRPLPIGLASADTKWAHEVETSLRQTFPEQLAPRLLPAPDPNLAINLVPQTSPYSRRCVAVGELPEASLQALQIMRAVLDEPVPLEEKWCANL